MLPSQGSSEKVGESNANTHKIREKKRKGQDYKEEANSWQLRERRDHKVRQEKEEEVNNKEQKIVDSIKEILPEGRPCIIKVEVTCANEDNNVQKHEYTWDLRDD